MSHNFETCQHTGAALTTTTIRGMDREIGDVWGDEVHAAINDPSREYMVEQQALGFTLNDIELHEKLGTGTYGQVYSCTIKGKGMVIKLNEKHEISTKTRSHDGAIKMTFKLNKVKRLETTVEAFNYEIKNYERMMEPKSFIKYIGPFRVQGWIHWDSTSREANSRQYNRMREELQLIQAHPGYKHMHKLLHFDIIKNVPFILSERCDGTLDMLLWKNTVERIDDFKPRAGVPSKLWLMLAEQLNHAACFMQDRGFMNVDIKPSNIFYAYPNGEMCFMVSDYGMCSEAQYIPKPDAPFMRLLRGTYFYSAVHHSRNDPDERGRYFTMTSEQVMLFQVATTLIASIDISDTDLNTFLNYEYDLHHGSLSQVITHHTTSRAKLFKDLRQKIPLFQCLYEVAKEVPGSDHILADFEEFRGYLKLTAS